MSPLVRLLLLACLALAACTSEAPAEGGEAAAAADRDHSPRGSRAQHAPAPESAQPQAPQPAEPPAPQPAEPPAAARPAWLGTRVLPLRPDGLGQIQPTPPELDDRRLPPPPAQAAPAPDTFAATVTPVPDAVVARSTWSPDCPVGRDDLRYINLTFWGFDDRPHTGELLVNARVAEDLVGVFRALYDARFPIEEMRVVAPAELDAPPTGDDNNTTAFVCRSMVSSGSWSAHAFGLAVDINPFHNPYARGDVVLPELASSYVDRARHRPGMIQPGDPVTRAFAAIGWPWGGDWRSSKDWMHFSHDGR